MSHSLSYKLHELTPFVTGAALKKKKMTSDPVYRQRALEQFNSFTPEKIFKTAYIQPQRGYYFWEDADALTRFCGQHQKHLHGHTLIWDRELPEWLSTQDQPQPAILEELVWAVTDRYKSRVRGWDVVNEAFDENGQLKQGIWHKIFGANYIHKAFAVAEAADSGASLFYNDFDLEVNSLKRKSVIRYLNNLRDKGTKIDGIGLQLHLNISSAQPCEIEDALIEISEAGYQIHLSEVDISVNPYEGVISGTGDLFSQQAALLLHVVHAFLQVPEKLRYALTFWGVGDADSWLTTDLKNVDYPLLFDENYEPKPAWNELIRMFSRGEKQ